MKMLEAWLHKHPPRSLWKLWKEYMEAVHSSVPPDSAAALANEVKQQAKTVAEASGGTLGFGKISQSEREVLDDIDSIFSND